MLYPFNPGSHYDLISRLLSIVLLGGLGSIGGAVVGALIVSVVVGVVAATISPTWSEMTFFVILLAGAAYPAARPVRHRGRGARCERCAGRAAGAAVVFFARARRVARCSCSRTGC